MKEQHIYLLLMVLGAVVPYVFFTDFFLHEGINLVAFIQALFANGAAGGFSADLVISSIAFWCYLGFRGTPKLWVYILLNLTIGLSCALPAYLYFTSKAGAPVET